MQSFGKKASVVNAAVLGQVNSAVASLSSFLS